MTTLVALLVLSAAPDHLVPQPAVLGEYDVDEYQVALAQAFLPDRYRDVQMLVVPSFQPEQSVYVRRPVLRGRAPAGVSPVVVSIRARKSLWAERSRIVAGGRRNFTATAEDQRRAMAQVRPDLDVAEAPLAEATVVVLEELWTAALRQVRYPEQPRLGLDGVTYHFADWTRGFGYRAGTVWLPATTSRLAGLVEVGEALAAYARTAPQDRPAAEQKLLEKSKALTARFAEPPERGL